MMCMKLILKALLVILFFAANASAAPISEYEDVKARVESFFKNTSTIVADFTQRNAEGQVSGGKFYLKRPGKFRWEYDERQPLLILSNGNTLVYRDNDLEETSYFSADQTLAGFLARDEIKLEGDIELYEAYFEDGLMKAKIGLAGKPEEGKLLIEIAKNDPLLVGLQVIDQAGYATQIDFSNQKHGVPIESSKFTFKDPKREKNVWER